jgi:hypothetical protein
VQYYYLTDLGFYFAKACGLFTITAKAEDSELVFQRVSATVSAQHSLFAHFSVCKKWGKNSKLCPVAFLFDEAAVTTHLRNWEALSCFVTAVSLPCRFTPWLRLPSARTAQTAPNAMRRKSSRSISAHLRKNASATKRFNDTLELFEHYREGLGLRLRQAAEELLRPTSRSKREILSLKPRHPLSSRPEVPSRSRTSTRLPHPQRRTNELGPQVSSE